MAQVARAVQARLGPLVSKAQSTLEPAYHWTEKQAITNYDKIMKQNQQYVVQDRAQADKLLKQLVFTNLARLGPDPASGCTSVLLWHLTTASHSLNVVALRLAVLARQTVRSTVEHESWQVTLAAYDRGQGS